MNIYIIYNTVLDHNDINTIIDSTVSSKELAVSRIKVMLEKEKIKYVQNNLKIEIKNELDTNQQIEISYNDYCCKIGYIQKKVNQFEPEKRVWYLNKQSVCSDEISFVKRKRVLFDLATNKKVKEYYIAQSNENKIIREIETFKTKRELEIGWKNFLNDLVDRHDILRWDS